MKAENEGLYDATQQRSSNAGEGQGQMIGTLEKFESGHQPEKADNQLKHQDSFDPPPPDEDILRTQSSIRRVRCQCFINGLFQYIIIWKSKYF